MTNDELLAHVITKVTASAERVFFTERFVSEEDMRLEVNSGRWGDQRQWRCNRLLGGVLAAHAPAFVRHGPDATPVLANGDMPLNFARGKTLAAMSPAERELERK